jgi:hypothetical protein
LQTWHDAVERRFDSSDARQRPNRQRPNHMLGLPWGGKNAPKTPGSFQLGIYGIDNPTASHGSFVIIHTKRAGWRENDLTAHG